MSSGLIDLCSEANFIIAFFCYCYTAQSSIFYWPTKMMINYSIWNQESILPNIHFSGFPNLAVKLECLWEREKYVFMRNGQAYQQKTEKFFVYEEKKFGRIDSRSEISNGQFLTIHNVVKGGVSKWRQEDYDSFDPPKLNPANTKSLNIYFLSALALMCQKLYLVYYNMTIT